MAVTGAAPWPGVTPRLRPGGIWAVLKLAGERGAGACGGTGGRAPRSVPGTLGWTRREEALVVQPDLAT